MRVLLEFFLDHGRRPHPHRRRIRVWLGIGETRVLMRPNEGMFTMSNLRLDQTVTLSIEAVDAAGNPVPAVFDAPPSWSNSAESVATMAVAADSLTAVLTPVAGSLGQSTTVTVSAVIGGATFSATMDYTITAGAVAGIRIVETFNPA